MSGFDDDDVALDFDGNFGAPSRRQQCRRPVLYQQSSFPEDSGIRKIILMTFFRQTGSVATQGESSTCIQGFEKQLTSTTNRSTHSDVGSGFLDRKRPVILDFERSMIVETSVSPLLLDSHTFEKDITTDDTSCIQNLSWEQQLGSTSKFAEHVHTPIVLDFQNSAIVSDSMRKGCSRLLVSDNMDLISDINASQFAGGNLGCFLNNGDHVSQFIGTKRRQAANRECLATARTVNQRRMARVVSPSSAGTSNPQAEGVSLCYKDIGDCDCVCEYCDAKFRYDNEVLNRLRHFGGETSGGLDQNIVQGLIGFLGKHNELVRLFRTARDKCADGAVPDFKIRLYSVAGSRQYDLPTSQTLGGIVVQSSQDIEADYDVIIESRGGAPQRINKLHPSYMSLQFPLLFIFGQPGFHPPIQQHDVAEEKRVSMNMFYIYQLHERDGCYGLLFRGGRLLQQYVVGVYCCIEHNRMDFYKTYQSDIKKDNLSGIYDAVARGDCEGSCIGSRIILPMSFTGGPRYMYSHYLDALAICRSLGNPQFFITFTCNVNWPEIKRHMNQYPDLLLGDRADVVLRVFHQKVKEFCKFLKDTRLFGIVTGLLYTIEFQKRGLPHCHTLLWVDDKDKLQRAEDIDQYISAELPDPKDDPQGHRVVSKMMVHGPCGLTDLRAPCVKESKCSKNFLKRYNSTTYFDKDSYAHYRRRETNIYTTRRGVDLDNTNIVPYNRDLCLTFHAHINVEYCGWNMLIKYLFKYISKGTDRIVAQITRRVGESPLPSDRAQIQVDEIQNFVDGRYIFTDPQKLWSKYWRRMFDDIPRTTSKSLRILQLHINDPELEQYALFELEIILKEFSKSLEDFGLPSLSRDLLEELKNRELMEEKSYNREELAQEVIQLVPKLNREQKTNGLHRKLNREQKTKGLHRQVENHLLSSHQQHKTHSYHSFTL
uniref:DNA helicase n=1 Tax=Tanacetum cinerariifolium TaxID=118510 RepID=A0A6L2P6H0_TANCI|nr:DNA helicase [Tanacetum cinerariifolium]